MLKITWERTESHQAIKGIDEDGNRYWMPANRETCYVTTPDGFKGCGWTEEEALASAEAERKSVIDNHNRVLEELKSMDEEQASTVDRYAGHLRCER